MSTPSIKLIDGHKFRLVDWFASKEAASRLAKAIRKNGFLARVVPFLVDRRYRRYAVYRGY